MSQSADIVVFGAASSGAVEQWDRHLTTVGILLRWFLDPPLNYPDFGFDLYRAIVPDVPPLPFNDLNVPSIQGRPSWTYANLVTLATTSPLGLRFASNGQGWWRLLITSSSASVTVQFTSPAWFVTVRADLGTTQLIVTGRASGNVVQQAKLTSPGASLTWRTRGIEQIEISGDGSVSSIGYHLLGDATAWTHIAHRCLPVLDPAYRCAPAVTGTEADEARGRLPAAVAAEWSTRFDAQFAAILPALHRWATGAAPSPIPPAVGAPDAHLNADERTAIQLAMLDPHSARILGLAYDDPLAGALDGHEYVYKVAGRWPGSPVTLDFTVAPPNAADLKRKFGLTIDTGGRGAAQLTLTFDVPVSDFAINLAARSNVAWTASDGAGDTTTGRLTPRAAILQRPLLAQLHLTWTGTPPPTIARLTFTPTVERVGLLPGIVATEPGPPPGPSVILAQVAPADSPSAIATASLDWPTLVGADGSIRDGQPLSYQVGHRRLVADPLAAQPTPPPARDADLIFDGAPIFVSSAQVQQPFGQRLLLLDRNAGAGLTPGWWGWWVRGVDVFGRVSAPSGWALAPAFDAAPPLAPLLLQAEWVQRNLPGWTVATIGRSVEAGRWLASSAADQGLVACWAFGPDQAAVSGDVDGFRLLLRLPAAPAGGAAGASLQYSEPWPAPLVSYGPTAIRVSGVVTDPLEVDPVLDATISAIELQPATLKPSPTGAVRSACRTDLDLDGASGVFVGGTLAVDGTVFAIVANGDGPALQFVVEHAAGAGPTSLGAAQVSAPAGQIGIVKTNAPALAPPAGLRVRSGALVLGGALSARLQVLRVDNGDYLVRPGGASVSVGDAVTWYPVWCAALDAAGFGPVASDTTPVANAQVAVQAVRSIDGTAIISTPGVPLTVTAVDLTTPKVPTIAAITFDPGDTCVVGASRADWYGKSRFTVSWTGEASRLFTLYRALGDEINRLDRLAHDKPEGFVAHDYPDASMWPDDVFTDATRKARVEAELTTLDQAFAAAGTDARESAIAAAYDNLTIDTQMLLASQDYAWPGYVALFGKPITAASYEDVLDGRSHGHYFYRVTSRTSAGVESAPSAATPPICCPDVVPPAAPLAHLALGGPGTVTLRWLASAEADWDHYEVFADAHAEAESELGTMTPVATFAPSPHYGGTILELAVARLPGEWCFWIVAVDRAGNQSRPSTMLRGRALRVPPAPPVWQSATRTPNGVALVWTHASDQRLACRVERRPGGGGYWTVVSSWLPRSVYDFIDAPPDVNAAWDYRLRVRDQIGQVASDLPVISIQAN